MTDRDDLIRDSPAELFENAPCGYLTTALDGTILQVNRTLQTLTGYERDALVGRRFPELLTVGGRIYYETHYAPLLQMQGWVREIAVDLVRADGAKLPALVNSVLQRDEDGQALSIRTVVFEATDRRRYEQELLRSRDHEHAVAAELQRGLLSGRLPRDPALDLAVSYRPTEGLDVGGDWYDAFWIGKRRIGVVVGDVVGRGIVAAATMGQLRSAVRALASTGLTPGRLLDALDGYARRHQVGQMTTLAYAELDLGSGALVLACAGHPPPAMTTHGGPAGFLWDGRSTPLDAAAEASARPESTVTLAPGATVVLFTDGLFERVDRPLQEGLDLVLAELDEHRHEPAAALADAVTDAALAGRQTTDDVCLLALHWDPS
ncbi:MAG TPA: SpoIIE family protein phosphatase [Baekduia sp.]|nr:SpoIIE family protein phosphatase [Baekduia sp.]